MANFLLIAVCIVAGILFRRSKTLPHNAHKGINAWLIYIGLPAVTFKYLPHITWSNDLLAAVIAPILVWVGAWVATKIYVRFAKPNKSTTGGLRLSMGLANTTFVGLPLIAAYFGEQYFSIAIICDQVTFFLLSTAGIIVAVNASDKHTITAGLIIKRVISFPPFIGCVAALTLPHFINLSPVTPLLEKLGATVAPLALFSVGLQLKFGGWLHQIKLISFAMLYKLLLAPALVLLVFWLLGFNSMVARIAIFEAAMPTLITSAIIAEQYDLNPKLSNLIIGIGIIVSLATTALWWFILR